MKKTSKEKKTVIVVASYKNGELVMSRFFLTKKAAENCIQTEENDFRSRKIISLTEYKSFLKTKGKSQSDIDRIIAYIEFDDEYYF